MDPKTTIAEDPDLTALDQIHGKAERRFRRLLAESGLPAPDEVTSDAQTIRFVWTERKVVVVLDLSELSGTALDEPDA